MTGKRPGANRCRLRNGDLARTWTQNQEEGQIFWPGEQNSQTVP
jgi:hypothetical protein